MHGTLETMQPIVHALRSPFTPFLLVITVLAGLVGVMVLRTPEPRASLVIINLAPLAAPPAAVTTQVLTPGYTPWCATTDAGCGIWNANYWRPMPPCWYTARGCN